MKQKIHPPYGTSVIRCACGNMIETRGTRPAISVDICSGCHPFYTGKQKLVDTAGRIDRFQKKYAGKVAVKKVVKAPPAGGGSPPSKPADPPSGVAGASGGKTEA